MRAYFVLENLGVRLPHRTLFDGVNWTLYEGMRVTLAGRNGSGKSTMMRIMAGQGEPTHGTCNRVGKGNLRVGYLDQSLLDSAVLAAKEGSQHTQNPGFGTHLSTISEYFLHS